MLIINVPRIVLYLLLIALAAFRKAPWWLPVSVLLYDARYPVWVKLPDWILRRLGYPPVQQPGVFIDSEHQEII